MVIRKVNVRDVLKKDDVFSDHALAIVDRAVDMAIVVQDEFGPRCPDFDAGCPTCKAWGTYDNAMRRFICN